MTPVVRSSVHACLYRLLPGPVFALSGFVFSCLLALPAFVSAETALFGSSAPAIKKGVLLVAHPSLADPNFRETVVLICEHGAEGTLGLILNRPTRLLLSEALPGLSILKGTSYVLFEGGPVQPDGILMLFRLVDHPGPLRNIVENVYLGLSTEALERVITTPHPTETFRAYAGYAGWAPGQLEFEMAMGSWAVVPADSSSIFDKAPETIWAEMIESLQAPRVIGLE
jgi:putative transcriptional regulator